ncbi:MAG: sugar ABC transporter permease, partial [Micrococcales bacterium]|nr:sugar ABC transporter permease [Micrococcales bacterium]
MRIRQGRYALIFLLPYLLVFIVFRLLPSIGGVGVSFFNWSLGGTPAPAGGANYARLVNDPNFWVAMKNTLIFFVATVPLLVVISLFFAVLVNQRLRGRNFVRALSIIPFVLIPAVVGIMWNWLYDNNFGLINYYLKRIGFGSIHWLTDSHVAIVAVSVVVIWTYVGYNMVLYLAGLQGIGVEMGEAAAIDGANRWQTFRYITLPLLLPVTMMVTTLTMINVIQLFDQIFVMTNGGPGTSTLTLVQYMYTSAFGGSFSLGYGSAIEVAILVLLLALIAVQNLIGNRSNRKES